MPDATSDGRVPDIIAAVAAARCRGEGVSDEQVIGRHPHLADELRRGLAFADVIAAAHRRIATGGPAASPITVLTDEELEAPIELQELAGLPTIEGYDLSAEVGRGGQGVVYRGTELSTGLDVAVKVLPGGQFACPRARSRFAREAAILGRLSCPNVVRSAGRGRTADGSLYLVTPYIDGLPLDEHAAGLAGDDAAVARLFAVVAEAVHACHLARVVHRDLKPSNVRVDRDGEPHVLDFGLAATAVDADKSRSLTGPDQILGSLPWASPDHVGGNADAVDARSDVYALGLMLCRAVSAGHVPPYPVDGPPDELIAHILRTTPVVAGRRPRDPLAGVALRCLAKRPADRYPSAEALAGDLRRVAAGQRPRGAVRPGRRHRWSSWRIGAAVLVLAGLGGAAVHNAGGPRVRPAAVRGHRTRTDVAGGQLSLVTPEPNGLSVWIGTSETTWRQYRTLYPGDLRGTDPDAPARVTAAEAAAFCAVVTTRDRGHLCRLPTTAELSWLSSQASPAAPGDAVAPTGEEWSTSAHPTRPGEVRPFRAVYKNSRSSR